MLVPGGAAPATAAAAAELAASLPPLWEVSPAVLAPSIAGDSVAALSARAARFERGSFENAKLCLALYTFAAGAGPGAAEPK